MYVVKRYTVAVVRERLAEALDEAERGEPVIIERKGVPYRLSLDRPTRRRTLRRSRIDVIDPAVLDGQWTWGWTPRGLTFRAKRRA
jgi:hypothetical protein